VRAYTFAKQAARQIQRAVRKSERNNPALPQSRRPMAQSSCYIGKAPVGGIAARSGTTPGTAEVEVWRINAAGTLEAVTDIHGTTLTLTGYNISSGAVSANAYVQVKQDAYGRFIVDFEDC